MGAKLSSVLKWLDISELKIPKLIDLCVLQALINGIYLTVAFSHYACYCVSDMQPEREK
jgi:hypothetical protein